MTIFNWIILALWLAFIAYWAVSAIGAKRRLDRPAMQHHWLIRLTIVVLAIIALRSPAARQALRVAEFHQRGIAMGAVGAALVALGLGFAVTARVYIGRNWSMPMSRIENPELVTGGPYALVRHPIYSGLILAMLGSAIGESVYWALPLILFGAYFVYSARREEKLMVELFPEQYPSYRNRTKMLVPFVL